MSITYRVLGPSDGDNALLVRVDSGQATEHLMFDCGEGCVSALSRCEVQTIDHLLFSHLHMDHVGGFDSFVRCTFDRDSKLNQLWGPPETARILQHKLQGFLWNLHEQMSGTYLISDIHPDQVATSRLELREAYGLRHHVGNRSYEGAFLEGEGYTVEALTMDHRTATLAYIVREKIRRNVNLSKLQSLGLRPGPWVKQLKLPSSDRETQVNIDGSSYAMDELREELIDETSGDSIAYLTDFLLDDAALDRLTASLHGCRLIVCEGQYRHADLDLARKNYHMTTVLSATLAHRVQAEELVLCHLSDRYSPEEKLAMLGEAQDVFPNTHYPVGWALRG